jgi:hypothetical protein
MYINEVSGLKNLLSDFQSKADLLAAFPTEESCIKYLEEFRWKEKVISPFDPKSKVYKSKNNLYKCKNTDRYFNVRTGTIFSGSKISLRKWFVAIYLFKSDEVISSLKVAQEINVTQKTAHFMIQRIKNYYESMIAVQLKIDF